MPHGRVGRPEGKDAGELPTTAGVILRLAAERIVHAGAEVEPLLRKVGLSAEVVADRDRRVSVRSQIEFLNLAAEILDNNLLGFHLARDVDLREIGPLYYMMASSERLVDAIDSAARYSAILDEGIHLQRGANTLAIESEYVGVERHSDRHQMEFIVTSMLRMSRHFTNRELVPTYVGFIHQREGDVSEMERYFGCVLDFGATKDRISFDPQEADLPLVTADPFLRRFLTSYLNDAMSRRQSRQTSLRTRVENAITPRLPHGTASIANIAGDLRMSTRTLSRRLAQEGLTFSVILEDLRANLANRYLQNSDLSISQIAWQLGYTEVSSFAHAFQRWTGNSPTRARRRISSHSEITRGASERGQGAAKE